MNTKHASTAQKLKGKHRLAVCEYLAMGFTPLLAAQELQAEFGVTCSRQNIVQSYLNSPKRRKTIKALRARRLFQATKHPLFYATNRLDILMRAINYALKDSTDKLYFDKNGNETGIIMKKVLGPIAPLIKEAREEAMFLTGKDAKGPEIKISLLQIIKDFTEKENADRRTAGCLGASIPGKTYQMDQPGVGPIRIL